jgi:hypothetical protein
MYFIVLAFLLTALMLTEFNAGIAAKSSIHSFNASKLKIYQMP